MVVRILIANRGEIAVRIIRACYDLDFKTIAIYSKADKNALFTRLADESYCIGEASPSESYLNIDAILELAIKLRVHAIHPGYGFLSENAAFAKRCEDEKIIFIGPSSKAISLMGDKCSAIKEAVAAGVPVIPGSKGVIKNPVEGIIMAEKIGFPLLIKASAGGGGKGMRVVTEKKHFATAYQAAQLEAKNAFMNGEVYLEKFLNKAKHIEIQVLADNFGNALTIFERDCSIQRNSQKIIEEAPYVKLKVGIRKKMYEAALRLVKKVQFTGVGTIEFLIDSSDNFYFIEMNTRIQVEHPVTEMITRIDLIQEQIRVSFSNKLSFKQNEIQAKGHSIEARINAENPKKHFAPSPGIIKKIHFPGGPNVRCDFGYESGDVIQPYYDSLIGKVIIWASTRSRAINKLKSALEELEIIGIDTNIRFIYKIISSDEFENNECSTSYIGENFRKLTK